MITQLYVSCKASETFGTTLATSINSQEVSTLVRLRRLPSVLACFCRLMYIHAYAFMNIEYVPTFNDSIEARQISSLKQRRSAMMWIVVVIRIYGTVQVCFKLLHVAAWPNWPD